MPYITPSAARNLKNHKYAGADNGFLYVYFYSPVANRLVELLPVTIAPNLLTLIGFLHTIVPFVIMTIFAKGSLMTHIPRWICFFQAWCYFAYRMLDEMDGKQARRTQNSSPLGLLFDHGCDAFSMGLQSIMWLIVA